MRISAKIEEEAEQAAFLSSFFYRKKSFDFSSEKSSSTREWLHYRRPGRL